MDAFERAISGAPVPDMPAALPAVVVRATPGQSFFDELALPGPEGETREGRDARRLGERLPEGYVPETGADMAFDPRIAYEIALGLSKPGSVFQKYGCTEEEARALIALPAFIATVRKYKEEVTEHGVSFRLKAKIQAEDLLSHSYILATDMEVPAAVRADLIKWTAKMAGLEPTEKEKGGGQGGAGSGFTLNISFAGTSSGGGRVIDVVPTLVQGG